MRFVGRVRRGALEGGALVRIHHPPFHVLVSLVNGEPCAIEDACNHAGASLSEGARLGDCVACPMHGYLFDLASGQLVEPQGFCDDQRCLVARTTEGDYVSVWDPGAGITIIGP